MQQKKSVLRLPLCKKWFDMIRDGIKTEEYREIKPYYNKRFYSSDYQFQRHYDYVEFTLGYPAKDDKERTLRFKNPLILIGNGRPEWGAQIGKSYWVITWQKE